MSFAYSDRRTDVSLPSTAIFRLIVCWATRIGVLEPVREEDSRDYGARRIRPQPRLAAFGKPPRTLVGDLARLLVLVRGVPEVDRHLVRAGGACRQPGNTATPASLVAISPFDSPAPLRKTRKPSPRGSSLEHELPPQCCYRMIAFTSSRTCSACQRLERQQNRSHIGICHLDS